MRAPASHRHVVAAALVTASVTSCGASLRALYESDVRFEHCMALDSAPEVKSTLKRVCWEEWVRYYQFGQTRDRIDHARGRKDELGSASDFAEADSPPKVALGVAPDPTSAIAPPPSMMATVDGGAHEPDERAATRARCTAACDEGREACRSACKRTAACDQACAGRLKRCVVKCEAPALGAPPQGSR